MFSVQRLQTFFIIIVSTTFLKFLFKRLYRSTACNAMRYFQDLSVRPFACLRQTHGGVWDKTKETWAHILTLHESFTPVFWQEEWLVGATPSTWNFGPINWPRSSKNADFQSILARSASAVTPSEKVQLTLLGSPLRAFQCSGGFRGEEASRLRPPFGRWTDAVTVLLISENGSVLWRRHCQL